MTFRVFVLYSVRVRIVDCALIQIVVAVLQRLQSVLVHVPQAVFLAQLDLSVVL